MWFEGQRFPNLTVDVSEVAHSLEDETLVSNDVCGLGLLSRFWLETSRDEENRMVKFKSEKRVEKRLLDFKR